MHKGREITITMSEYNQLRNSQNKLEALEQNGVDNWQGYEDAMDDYVEEDELEGVSNGN